MQFRAVQHGSWESNSSPPKETNVILTAEAISPVLYQGFQTGSTHPVYKIQLHGLSCPKTQGTGTTGWGCFQLELGWEEVSLCQSLLCSFVALLICLGMQEKWPEACLQACQEARLQLDHIGLLVVTKSAGTCVHDMVWDPHYSLCPSLSSYAYKVITHQGLGTGCRARAEGSPRPPSLYEVLSSKIYTAQCQMLGPGCLAVLAIHSFIIQ